MDGSELQAWRKSCGLSQLGLAQRLGVSERTVQSLEAGGPLKLADQLMVDMAAMYLALDHERDAGVLTDTALRVWTAVEAKMTPQVRARLDPVEALALTPVELAALRAMGALLGRDLTSADQRRIVAEMRASSTANGALIGAAGR